MCPQHRHKAWRSDKIQAMISIGPLSIRSRLILAPMAGITDLPFRLIARSFGCAFAYIEMVSARSIVYQSGRTARMLGSSGDDRPLGAQLLGNEPDSLLKALDMMRPNGYAVMDFNAACPVEKITRKGKGASLLKDPALLRALLRVMVQNSDVPVTVKIRAGWDSDSINARDIALLSEDAGVSAVTIHGRTKRQMYGGRVDYEVIRQVKEALSIPVVASGDALSPQLIKKMFDETGCDAVAIARGALGNPWIFRDAGEYLEKGVVPPRPSADEVADTMLRHFEMNCQFYGEKKGAILFRKLFPWYVKGFHEIRQLKEDAFRASPDDMKMLISAVRGFEYRHAEGVYEGPVLSC
jgi:tRNA-dihydrouridine synthase B